MLQKKSLIHVLHNSVVLNLNNKNNNVNIKIYVDYIYIYIWIEAIYLYPSKTSLGCSRDRTRLDDAAGTHGDKKVTFGYLFIDTTKDLLINKTSDEYVDIIHANCRG